MIVVTPWQWEPPSPHVSGLQQSNRYSGSPTGKNWNVVLRKHHGLPRRMLLLWPRGRSRRPRWAAPPQHPFAQQDPPILLPSPAERRVQSGPDWWLLLWEDRFRLLLWGLQGMSSLNTHPLNCEAVCVCHYWLKCQSVSSSLKQGGTRIHDVKPVPSYLPQDNFDDAPTCQAYVSSASSVLTLLLISRC